MQKMMLIIALFVTSLSAMDAPEPNIMTRKNCFPDLTKEQKEKASILCGALGGASGATTAALGTCSYITFLSVYKSMPLSVPLLAGYFGFPVVITLGAATAAAPCIVIAHHCANDTSEEPNEHSHLIN